MTSVVAGVLLIVPLTAQTRGLVDAGFLAAMRDGALLVNAARGPVVDTAALTAELASGRLGAALDVTDPEPLPSDHPLWRMPNVLITPHVGGSVRGLLRRGYRLAALGELIRKTVAEGPPTGPGAPVPAARPSARPGSRSGAALPS